MFGSIRRFFRSSSADDGKGDSPGIPLRPRDCHSHIIPAVDDGSRSTEESLEMLRLLQSAGAQTVIATPHIFPQRYPNEPDPLRRAFDALQRAVSDASDLHLEIELGAEHYLDETLPGRIRRGDILSFGPESYVLVETTTGPIVPVELYDMVNALRDAGHVPLLAHIERYRWLRGEEGEDLLADLRAAGVRFQVNRTVGKMNQPGRGPRGAFLSRLLQLGWIDEVGSDLHRPTPEGRPYTSDELSVSAKQNSGVEAAF